MPFISTLPTFEWPCFFVKSALRIKKLHRIKKKKQKPTTVQPNVF